MMVKKGEGYRPAETDEKRRQTSSRLTQAHEWTGEARGAVWSRESHGGAGAP